MSPGTKLPQLGEYHHVAYVVADLEAAVAEAVDRLGAGPFFFLEEVPLEDVTSQGRGAEFNHNSAFGYCGGTPIELMQINSTAPELVDARFAGARPSLHHIAWVLPAERADALRNDLDREGIPEYLHARLGEIDFTYHDGSSLLGHDIEIHADCEGLRGFFAMFREAAEGWDGSDPLRPAMG